MRPEIKSLPNAAVATPESQDFPAAAPGRAVAPEPAFDAVAFMRRNAGVIGLATLAALAFGGLYGALAPTRYRSVAELLVDPRGFQILSNAITRPGESADANLVDVENQRYLILSRSVLAKVVKSEGLADNAAFNDPQAGLAQRLKAALGIRPAAPDLEARALAVLGEAVDVVRNDRAYVLDVAVTTGNAELSAKLANAVAQAYLQTLGEERSNAQGRASGSLSKRAAELQGEVRQADERVQAYRAEHALAFTAAGLTIGEQQIGDLSAQLGLARAKIAEAQARVGAIDAARRAGLGPAASAEAIQSPTIVALRAQYAQAAQAAASLAQQMGPRHPQLLQAQEQLAGLRRQISDELGRVAGAAQNELARARESEAKLEKRVAEIRSGNDVGDAALVEFHSLERAADTSRAVYQAFLTRAKELGESQGIDTTNARVISQAIPATKPTTTPMSLILASSLVFGLGLGGGLGYLRERLDGRIGSRRELADLTGLPILAAFALEPDLGARDAQGQLAQAGSKAGAPAAPVRIAADRGAFLGLIGRLGLRETPARVAFVGPGEGRAHTQLVAGLAAFASQEGIDVAIVDCGGESGRELADAFAPSRGATRINDRRSRVKVRSGAFFPRDARRGVGHGGEATLAACFGPEASRPRDILAAADRLVLVLEDADMTQTKLRREIDALAELPGKLAGIVTIGWQERA